MIRAKEQREQIRRYLYGDPLAPVPDSHFQVSGEKGGPFGPGSLCP